MKKKILIVDDCKNSRQNIKACFNTIEYIVDEAHDGEMAFSYCMNKKPDLILLDKDMPNLCGLGFLRLYRDTLSQMQKLPPVIMYYQDKKTDFIAEALELGAIEIINSPFKKQVLEKSITRLGVFSIS